MTPPFTPGAPRLWRCASGAPDGREELARALGVSPTVAGLLIARGCADSDSAHRFLHPSLADLHDPFLLPDMEAAVTRLARALESGETVLVHGDYDVDGVTAAALMTRVLRALGGNVQPFVPHRREDGYDLRVPTVQRAAQEGVQLIVTVDCGIVAHQAAECARELGVDLIVTDHHHPGETLPNALAVVNPQRADSHYPFKGLAGVGVAFKTATALVRQLGVPETSFRTKFLDLVALGTTVDCMPLLDENRVFVKFGLEVLKKTAKPGLRALMDVARVEPGRLDSRSLSFTLGPRINAVGRLDEARHALDLLLTGDEKVAAGLARKLDRCNLERQLAQHRILEEALQQSRRAERKDDRVLVLADPHWHSGVIGIVAGKMAEAIGRPVIMIALDGETGRGSARSIDGFHIFEAITACQEVLERCGGHAQAAGFDIRADRVEEFRERLCQVAAESLSDESLQPRIDVDAFLNTADIDLALARELRRLEPFGHGNPEPVFATRAFPLLAAEVLPAKTGTQPHLTLRLGTGGRGEGAWGGQGDGATDDEMRDEHPFGTDSVGSPPRPLAPSPPRSVPPSRVVPAVYWRSGEKADELRGVSRIDLCYHLEINEFRGVQEVRLNVKDLRLPQEEIE
jgi:single-stranded-DNA-specific exonuclease